MTSPVFLGEEQVTGEEGTLTTASVSLLPNDFSTAAVNARRRSSASRSSFSGLMGGRRRSSATMLPQSQSTTSTTTTASAEKKSAKNQSAPGLDLNQFLADLEAHRQMCQNEGRYVEAMIAKKRLEELRVNQTARALEALKSRQASELAEMEEAHMEDFQAFSSAWDEKMEEFDDHASSLEASIADRHLMELQDHKESKSSKLLQTPFPEETIERERDREN